MTANRLVITVVGGAQDGLTFQFSGTPITMGRHPDDDVFLPFDPRISRHHARIELEEGNYYIEDVGPRAKGSTNGTYVNENRVAGKTRILPGDVFLLGSVYLRFSTEESDDVASSGD